MQLNSPSVGVVPCSQVKLDGNAEDKTVQFEERFCSRHKREIGKLDLFSRSTRTGSRLNVDWTTRMCLNLSKSERSD